MILLRLFALSIVSLACAVDLVKFSTAEERLLDDGLRRSSLSRSGGDSGNELVEFTEEEEAALSQGWNAARQFQFNGMSRAATRVAPSDYCAHYKGNYGYYCLARTFGNEPLVQKILKFCPSYKEKCVIHAHLVSKDPFHVLQDRVSPDFPDIDAHHRVMTAVERAEQLAKLIPCTPKCNVREFPHCTKECKCDYDYPRVQRFCNPPPMPIFLNTCRLWYYGCPKYAAYHYASQYIYSKAGKGKSIAGMAPVSTAIDYGSVSPGGFAGSSGVGVGGMSAGFGTSSGVSTPFGGMGMSTSIG